MRIKRLILGCDDGVFQAIRYLRDLDGLASLLAVLCNQIAVCRVDTQRHLQLHLAQLLDVG